VGDQKGRESERKLKIEKIDRKLKIEEIELKLKIEETVSGNSK
jgi:hypothetical protein